jgi:hypothetical protein
MDQSRGITANFSRRPALAAPACFGSAKDQAYWLVLGGEFGRRFRIEASPDLADWTPLATVTNVFGTMQFDDQSSTHLPRRFYRAVAE